MFIYADESGNSGRNIFDANEWYRLGAIFTSRDAEPPIEAVIRPVLSQRGEPRLHAKDMMEHEIGPVLRDVLDALDANGPWEFSLTVIHKPYLGTTKFVDTVFDAGENLAVPPMWYNLEFFRHTLCVAIDDALTPLNRQRFWTAYMADDVSGIQACIRNARTYVLRKVDDRRIREVIVDGFDFALRHPEELTLGAAARRDSYKGHTPNMVAFTCLLGAVHGFVDKHGSRPIAFFHDQQDEFKKTMKETHEIFGPVRAKEHPAGAIPALERSDYDLGRFSMPASKDMVVLQAADLLVWASQRDAKNEDLRRLQGRLAEKTADFHISRRMSDMIVAAWIHRDRSRHIPQEQLAAGKRLFEESEAARLARLRAFKEGAKS
jgi:hypothetical protein